MIRWAIACVALYAVFVGALLVAGRRGQARALAGFIPDCIVLVRRLLGDERLSRSRKAVLAGLVAYLALPFDLVPDFIPIAGQLDDAILVAVVLRAVFRDAGPAALREHWPGPEESLRVLMRIVSTTTTGAGRRRWHGR